MRLSIVIHKEADSDYGVSFPDLPGCISAGSTMDETINMAQEAAECHLEGMVLDNNPLPQLQPIEVHQKNEDFANAVLWGFIDIDLSKLSVKSKRINISLPEHLLTAIDKYAAQRHESRSEFIAIATTEYMATHVQHHD